jgi:hypothetical protein
MLGMQQVPVQAVLGFIQVNIPVGHLDFLHLRSYLAGDPSSSFTISRCSCCSPRKRMVSCDGIKADRTSKICLSLPEQPLFAWDGVLSFPEYWLVVPTALGTFDVHSLDQLSTTCK